MWALDAVSRLPYPCRGLLGLLWALCLLVGCRSTNSVLLNYEGQMGMGAYAQAAQTTVQAAEKGDGDELLWRLLAGKAYLLAPSSEEAVAQLDLAEDLFQANDSSTALKAGAEQAKAMLGSELSFAYRGFGQDRIFCCLYKGLAYASLGNVAATRTELNRAAEHQENWLFERRREIAQAEQELEEAVARQDASQRTAEVDPLAQQGLFWQDAAFAESVRQNTGFDMATSGNLERLAAADYSNAYLAHLCGIFRWLQGDGGREFLRDAAALRPASPLLQGDFQAVSQGGRPRNQVWLYVEDGLCPARTEWRLDLPLFLLPYVGRYALYAGMALPRLEERSAAAERYWLGGGAQGEVPLEVLENVDRLVRTEYDVYMRGALKREIVRTLAKVSAQVAFQIAIDNCEDGGARLALKVAEIGVGAWAAGTTAADLREWVSLPKVVWVGRIERPGDGKLSLVAETGGLRESLALEVPEGNTLVWVRKFAPSSPMVARVVTYPNP